MPNAVGLKETLAGLVAESVKELNPKDVQLADALTPTHYANESAAVNKYFQNKAPATLLRLALENLNLFGVLTSW